MHIIQQMPGSIAINELLEVMTERDGQEESVVNLFN